MFYNSYAKEERDKFANKITLVTCPEEKEIEKFCWVCEHYQPKTLNNGYCKLDESKFIRCGAYICDKTFEKED